VLGVNKIVITGHGISHARAFDNMIQLAKKMHEENLIDKIRNAFINI
jgi:phosphate acyltransferase